MIFSARSRKQLVNRVKESNSKDSKKSNAGKSHIKMLRKTQIELKLIQSINIKFEKSKIKNYKYVTHKQMHYGEDIESDTSEKLQKIQLYANLIGRKFINLKEYHNIKINSQSQNKYLIRTKFSEKKKSHKTQKTQSDNYFMSKIQFLPEKLIQKELNFRDRLFVKNKGIESSQYRIAHSGQKEYRLKKNEPFQFLSQQKNSHSFKRVVTLQNQNRSRLHYLRKQKKSPSPNVII